MARAALSCAIVLVAQAVSAEVELRVEGAAFLRGACLLDGARRLEFAARAPVTRRFEAVAAECRLIADGPATVTLTGPASGRARVSTSGGTLVLRVR